MKSRPKKGPSKQQWSLYLMALPAMLYLFINNYLPLAGLVVAFKNFNYADGIFKSPWNGLDNFTYLFSTSTSWIITRNTIVYNVAFIIINTVISVTAALLLNEIRSKKSLKAFQTVILLPYLLSIIIVGYLTYAFLSMDTGFLNKQLLPLLGIDPIQWYGEAKYWPFILIFINTLKNFGFLTLIYYSSLISIDSSYFEAAALDGATKFQQIRWISLPFLKPTIIMMVLMSVGRIFYSDFGLFYHIPMNSGALYSVTNTIDTYVYRALIQLGDVGMAGAAGLYQSLVGFLLILIVNGLVRKFSPENALF